MSSHVLAPSSSSDETIRYDTIIFTCAQKPTKGQLSIAHGTETKNKEKLKQTSTISEEMVQLSKSP